MKEILKRGATSNILRVFLQDSASASGAGKTGLTNASSGLIISTIADLEATATTYTSAASNVETITTLGTFAAPTAGKCRFREVDATNFPGVYEIQIADARFNVSNSTQLLVSIQCTGVAPVFAEFQLIAVALMDTSTIADAVWGADKDTPYGGGNYGNTTFGRRVLRGASTQADVSVTGSNHVAADVHEIQPGTIVDADWAAGSTYSKLATLIEADTPTGYRYTAQALEQAPIGGTVRMGPFEVKADGGGSDQPLDIQTGATHGVDCILIDGNGTGIDLTGATLTAKVYNTAGTLVATVTGTATYAAGGAMTWTIPTSVTNTAGTYTATITRTTGASDSQVFGQLRIYVREV